MITYFKDKNHISKKKYKEYKILTTILKSFDTIVIFATKPSFFTLFFTGIDMIVTSISTGTTCGLLFSNKLLYEIVMQKYIQKKDDTRKIKKLLNLLITYKEKINKVM